MCRYNFSASTAVTPEKLFHFQLRKFKELKNRKVKNI